MKNCNKIQFRIVSGLMVLMIVLSFISPFVGQAVVYGENLDQGVSNESLNYGEIPDPSKVNKAEASESLDLPFNNISIPSSYDLRNEDRLTAVKNQGDDGNCWAFAACGSLESHLTYEKEWDFSENHMKNTHGFDTPINKGGNRSMATAYLARGGGPVLEDNDPYYEGSFYSDSNLPIEKLVKEVLYIPDREANSPFDNDRIKWAIMEHGGVHTSMRFENAYHNFDTNSHYCPYDNGQRKSNHGVLIVGWDDNYSANNFLTKPQGNGAFIVKNSWGPNWGEDGYFYVSYYDKVIGINNTVYINPVEPDEYNNIYQYDELGWTGNTMGYRDSSIAWGANVFQCKDENEVLDGVSFYTNTENTGYEIWVNPNFNLNNDFINGGKKVAEGVMSLPGYHTVDLDGVIPLTKDNKFSIAIKFIMPQSGNPILLERANTGYSSKARSNSGESFISSNGNSWTDLNIGEKRGNVCIKGFTKTDNIVEKKEYDLMYTIPKDHDYSYQPIININQKNYFSEGNYIYGRIFEDQYDLIVEDNEDNWVLKFDKLPFDKGDLFIGITTGKSAYIKNVDSSNIGDKEVLSNKEFVELSVDKKNINKDESNLFNMTDLYYLDENDVGCLVGTLEDDTILVPMGNYDMKVKIFESVSDSNEIYNLIYDDVKISKDIVLPILEDNIVKINFDLKAFNLEDIEGVYMRQFLSNNSTHFGNSGLYRKGFHNSLLEKVNIYDYSGWLRFDVDYNDDYLQYMIYDDLKEIDTLDLKLSPNIKAYTNLDKDSYKPNEKIEWLNGVFYLKDEYGNYCQVFRKNGVVKIKKDGVIIEEYSINRLEPIVRFIELPSEVGTYTIEYSVPGYSLVEPSQTTIEIVNDKPIEKLFEDPNLEKAIRDKINKPNGELHEEDLLNINDLSINEREITSLEGIQNLKNLRDLNLSKNNIKDIAEIGRLINLENLSLLDCMIEDISPISNLKNLRTLDLENNNIKDISPIYKSWENGSFKEIGSEINLNKNYIDLEDQRSMKYIEEFKNNKIYIKYENQKIPFNNLPGGGNTIILGNRAYERNYLMKNIDIMEKGLLNGERIFVKLNENIYLNQERFAVRKEDIPKIIKIIGFENLY